MLIAVFNQREPIGILSELVVLDRLTDPKLLQNQWEQPPLALMLHIRADRVEWGHALPAVVAREDILMGVHKGVDALLTQSKDQVVDLVQVGEVIDVVRFLDCLPHDAEADQVEAPVV